MIMMLADIISGLKKITEDYKFLPEAAGIIGLLLLVFKRGRRWIMGFIKGLYTWIVFPFKSQDVRTEILSEISGIKTELQKNTKISEETAKEVASLKSLVGHHGGRAYWLALKRVLASSASWVSM
jgi:hypothetical protein